MMQLAVFAVMLHDSCTLCHILSALMVGWGRAKSKAPCSLTRGFVDMS